MLPMILLFEYLLLVQCDFFNNILNQINEATNLNLSESTI